MFDDKKGFMFLELILIIVFFVLVGLGIWYITSNNTGNTETDTTSSQTSGDTSPQAADEVHYVADTIKLTTSQDLDKLPANTPESFKSYLTNQYLKANKISTDACILEVSFSILSLYNYSGGLVPVQNPNSDEECPGFGGGKLAIGSADQGATWSSVGGQTYPNCDDVVAANLHQEFVPTCFKDESGSEPVDNPLGYLGSKADYEAFINSRNK